jgi:hypothetical protein
MRFASLSCDRFARSFQLADFDDYHYHDTKGI